MMKKQIFFLVMLLMPMLAWADASGSCGENVTYTYTEETKTLVISGTGGITSTPWYSYKTDILTVIIENGVTSVGDYAFSNCSGLTSLEIPNSLTAIGHHAFENCSGLTSMAIPNGVTSIGVCAFMGCSGLTSLEIPNSVTTFGVNAFEGCDKLTCLNINTTTIGVQFRDSKSLKEVTIGDKVTGISQGAFSGCSDLVSVTIPKTVTSIGGNPFESCPGITRIVVEEGNPNYDSRDNCNAIIATSDNKLITGCQNTVIPNTVTKIASGSFQGCSTLTSISIPSSVTEINNLAFEGCSGLTEFVLPKTVTKVSQGILANCPGLTSIVVEEGNPNYHSQNNCNAIIENRFYIYYNVVLAGCKNTVIPDFAGRIENQAFEGCTGLTSIIIPASVNSIGYYAFRNCTNLTLITIPDDVNRVGSSAFENTPWYDNQPDGLVYIGKVAYKYKGTMPENTNIVMKEGTTEITPYAFQGCSGLTSVTIPSSVRSIGNGAFSGCSGLTSVTVGMKTPVGINQSDFSNRANATLYVPEGSKEAYEAAQYWKEFKEIIELALPAVDGDEDVDFDDEIDGDTNLDGNVVGDIYYNISSGDGSYNAAEGCIVVTKPTDDTAIDGKDIFGEDFKDNFTGIVFKVPAGKGTVTVEAETKGDMVLKVKIGDATPVSMELEGRLKVEFPYDVTEPTYVYIYGGSKAVAAPGARRASTEDSELKLFGLKVSSSATGIMDATRDNATAASRCYTLDGRAIDGIPAKKGVYIVNGRKVVCQ